MASQGMGRSDYEAQWLKDWAAGLKKTHTIDVEVVERQGKGFQVMSQD